MQTILYLAVTLVEIGLAAALVGMAQNSRGPSRPAETTDDDVGTASMPPMT